MSGDITTEAVRHALGMQDLQARLSSANIAGAHRADARVQRADFGRLQGLLNEAAQAGGRDGELAARLRQATSGPDAVPVASLAQTVQLDEQVGDMVAASLNYQSLSEALSRHFGLMRLAVTGRS